MNREHSRRVRRNFTLARGQYKRRRLANHQLWEFNRVDTLFRLQKPSLFICCGHGILRRSRRCCGMLRRFPHRGVRVRCNANCLYRFCRHLLSSSVVLSCFFSSLLLSVVAQQYACCQYFCKPFLSRSIWASDFAGTAAAIVELSNYLIIKLF